MSSTRKQVIKMSAQIDFRTLPANVPVLCIPRVKQNISESHIRRIFDDLNMGTLERIDIVSKNSVKSGAEKGEKSNRVFVHFRHWNDTENANIARERLLNGKEIKIIYDDPWFWKISAYREPDRKPNIPPRERPSYNNNHVNEGLKNDYGPIKIPFRKERNYTNPEITKEEGEVVESSFAYN